MLGNQSESATRGTLEIPWHYLRDLERNGLGRPQVKWGKEGGLNEFLVASNGAIECVYHIRWHCSGFVCDFGRSVTPRNIKLNLLHLLLLVTNFDIIRFDIDPSLRLSSRLTFPLVPLTSSCTITSRIVHLSFFFPKTCRLKMFLPSFLSTVPRRHLPSALDWFHFLGRSNIVCN